MDYKSSGVDIDKGNQFIENIKDIVGNSIGGFASTFELPTCFKQPVLVSSTDGVGTKLKIAAKLNSYFNIGVDLVAMSVNDVITTGASPLFFLDYISTSNLEIEKASIIIQGINQGCFEANCSLIGGETAEMPGLYSKNEYDLAGFCVGIVEKSRILSKDNVNRGDLLIGLESNGFHSNGFSLIRNVLKEKNIALDSDKVLFSDSLEYDLVTPTKIYVKPFLNYLLKEPLVKSASHITGGGLEHNILRSVPSHLSIEIDKKAWVVPYMFDRIQDNTEITDDEMYKVFNMGIGFVLIIDPSEKDNCIDYFNKCGIQSYLIGKVI